MIPYWPKEKNILKCVDIFQFLVNLVLALCFPGGSDGKVSACNVGGPGFDPWVGKIPWRRKWQPILVLLPGKSHGQRSLVAYSPWHCKESDMTKRLNFQLSIIKWSNEGCPSKHAYYWAGKSKWKHTGP